MLLLISYWETMRQMGRKSLYHDLFVICEQQGLTENNYVVTPSLIIEILSPSNQSHDLVTKLIWYMKYGVKEYWIVNPMLNTVQVYSLEGKEDYRQKDIVKNEGGIQSFILNGFAVDAKELFTVGSNAVPVTFRFMSC